MRDGKLQVIRDFGNVMNACGWGHETVTTITYRVAPDGLELATTTKPRVCK